VGVFNLTRLSHSLTTFCSLRHAFFANRTDFSTNSAKSANDPDKGKTNIWPRDQRVPPPNYDTPTYIEIDEVIMWSSIDPWINPWMDENRPAVATTPTSLAAAEIMDTESSSIEISDVEMKRSKGIRTVQPLVRTACHWVQADNLKGFGDWIDYPARNGSIIRLSTFAEVEKNYWSNFTLGPFVDDDAPSPIWKVAPDDPESLVGIFLGPSWVFEGKSPSLNLITCLILSYWWMSEASLAFLSDPPRRRLVPEIPHLTSSGAPIMKTNLRPIIINPANIRSLNTKYFTTNTTNTTSYSQLVLAMVWADALSQLPYMQLEKIRQDLVWGDRLKQTHSWTENHDPRGSWSHFTITDKIFGFGYGSTDTPSKLAVAVITAYCLISLLFVAYIITTGHTSIAWNSAMELIVLALQSKEPDGLGHVSVGLDSMDTFRRTVGIRVNTVPVGNTGEIRERLKLVFEHDEDAEKRGLTKVVRNRAY
jgi:hypothetical protein